MATKVRFNLNGSSRSIEVDDAEMPLLYALRNHDRPRERPWGAGEPAAAVVPSAIANAIYDATGARVRSVPFTADKVRAALKT